MVTRWFTRLDRVKLYAAIDSSADNASDPSENISSTRVRSPRCRGRMARAR